MEPKDLKNSEVELSGAQVEPETVNDQEVAEAVVETSEVAEVAEVENAVAEVAPEVVAETVEPEAEAVVTEPEAEPIIEEVEPEVIAEPAAQEVVIAETAETVAESVTESSPVEEVIPSIEELIEVTEEDLLTEEDEVEVDNSRAAKLASYANLSEVELINALHTLLENDDFESVKDDIDAIKIYFFRLYRANIEAQKAAFAEAGGNMDEFKAEPDPYELDLRNLLKTISGQEERA